MFSLIVSGTSWSPSRDTFSRGRVFEFTDDALVTRFKPEEQMDIDAISKLPTLFVTETSGTGDQLARVGTITQLRLAGSEYQIEYAFDPAIPPIPNKVLEKIAGELEIENFEFSRTHWAVKSVDLFKVLLRNEAAKGPAPKVFHLDYKPVSDKLISVMMPFHPGFDDVYAALTAAATQLGKRCNRADNIWNHDAIIQDVVSLICKSSVVICDLSGKNANVFYEAGIAHCLGKDVILITQSADDVPFDLRHLRHIQYLNNGEGLQQLTLKVLERIQTLENRS